MATQNDQNGVHLAFVRPDFSYFWYVDFGRADGVPLAPGMYSDAARFPFNYLNGLDVGGSGGGCNVLTGRFLVREIEYAPGGGIVRFAADFEQHCEDAPSALFGAVRFNSSISDLTPFFGIYPIYQATVIAPSHGRISGDGIDCGGASSTCDRSFDAPAQIALTAIPDTGYVFVGWTGSCAGKQQTTTLNVYGPKECGAMFDTDATTTPRFVFFFDSDDSKYPTHRYAGSTGRWRELQADSIGSGVAGTFVGGDNATYRFNLSSTSGTPLMPGIYVVSPSAPDSITIPFVSIGSSGCQMVPGSRAIIGELSATAGVVDRFAAEFDIQCTWYEPPIHITIRYNSALPLHLPVPTVSITADKSAPQGVGTPITFTAIAVGGVGPTQFKWFVFTGTTWILGRDWSTDSTFTWTPSAVSPNARVGVWTRSGASLRDAADAAASVPFPVQPTVTLTWAQMLAPRSYVFTASATGGVAPYSTKWFVFNGRTWSVARNWSTGSTFTWAPSSAGTYRIALWVRSAGDTEDSPETATFQDVSVAQGSRVAGVTLSADLVAPRVPGTTVTFTAAATGGLPPTLYRWWLFSPERGWVIARDWTTAATFAWTPATESADYIIGVWALSADGLIATAPDATASMPFPIQRSRVTSVVISADHVAPRPPATSTIFTATAAGGTLPRQFKWFVFNGTSWLVVADWSVNATFTFTPALPNANYRVGVWVRGGDSSTDAPEAATSMPFAILIPPPAVTITSDLPSPQPPGTGITFTAIATGGVAPYEFKWFTFNGVTWTAVTGWSSNNSFVLAGTPAVSRVGVWVRSAGSATDAPDAAQSMPYLFMQ